MKFERKRDVIFERDMLRDKVAEMEKTISELKAKIRGDVHDTGVQCDNCVNLLRGEDMTLLGRVEKRMCKLDVKCKDRKESNL